MRSISIMPHSLQSKFLAGLGLVMALMVGFFALALNLHLERLMEGEAREKAALILSQVEAIQGYVRTNLRPVMPGSNQNQPKIANEATGMITPHTVTPLMRPVMRAPPKLAMAVSQIAAITPRQVWTGVSESHGSTPVWRPSYIDICVLTFIYI